MKWESSLGTRGVCKCFVDADWAWDAQDSKSTTDFVALYNGGPIFWKSAKQKTVANSTAESEYVAAGDVTRRVLGAVHLLADFGISSMPVMIQSDNQACLKLVENPITSDRTKHIRIQRPFCEGVCLERGSGFQVLSYSASCG